jgi:hypothetical protein
MFKRDKMIEFAARGFVALVTACSVVGATTLVMAVTGTGPYETPAPEVQIVAPATPWLSELTDDYARCRVAMATAEIPGTVGTCTRPRVTEDSAFWSCRTMGNGACGPDAVTWGNGRYVA